MTETKSADQLLAEALERRETFKVKENRKALDQEIRAVKAIDRYRKAKMKELPPFWWTAAFRPKVELAHDLAKLQASLGEYENHCRNQAWALTNLYQWALAHDPGDGSLNEIKKMLGPIKTPSFNGGQLG